MSERPYMKLWISDYLGDTKHLSTEEHGAYLLLLFAMWNASGYLPNDPKVLARIAGLTPFKWAKVSPTLDPFFLSDGERITQKRLLSELSHCKNISEVRSKARAARPLKNKEPPPTIVPTNWQQKPDNWTHSHSHSHSHSNQEGLQEDGSCGGEDAVDRLIAARGTP